MLAISPLRSSHGDERDGEVAGFASVAREFSDDFANELLLEDINFDDLFMGLDDGDALPDLEVDPTEIFAEFSVSSEEELGMAAAPAVEVSSGDGQQKQSSVEGKGLAGGGEVASAAVKADESAAAATRSSSSIEGDRGRKQTVKNPQGKRKVKVDWTPELHRRFVQAVEQLGVDKAVPSRILELMGIDCLTRHNVASHLQKYRSHRKHLLAREAEAASWSQRRQMYAAASGGAKSNMNPWLVHAIGFPPPPPPPPPFQPFRPLHVWGHPSPVPARSPPPRPWAPPPSLTTHPPPSPSYWHPAHYPRGPSALTPGTPCFPQPMPTMRFSAPPVPGIPPHPIYRPECAAIPVANKLSNSVLSLDALPSKESIDAAIGDVLGKPWLPLPLGLKPPSLESVLVELQRQGISKIPPACG